MKSLVRMSRPKTGAAAAVVVALAILLFAAAPAWAVTPKFSAPVGYTVGDSPHAVAVGDFNGDGVADVATASNSGNTISILLGQGNGKLGAARSVTVGLYPSAIVAADFNGDGKLDLAVANYGSNTVSILHGNGAGGFTLAQTVAVGAGPMSLACGDLNRDGKPDLAVSCYTGKRISVLIQNAAGSFVAHTLPAPASPSFELEGPRAIAIADADHDGKLDIVFTSSFRRYDNYTEDLGIYYGNGAGGFATPVSMVSVPDGVMDLCVCDVNGDGLTEIVGASWTADQVWMSVENGKGDRGFSTPDPLHPIFANAGYPGSLIVQDFNGDGVPDIAVTLPAQNEIEVALSRYRTPYWQLAAKDQTTVTLPAGELPGPMAAADLNRDGTADLVVGDYGSNTVSVLTRTWPLRSGAGFQPYTESDQGTGAEFASLAVGDLNDDGTPDVVSNLSSFLGGASGSFGAPVAHAAGDYECLADVNGDGILDLVSADTAGNRVLVALGAGDGTFAAPVPFATGAGPVRVMVADVNGDGKPDIVTSNSVAGTVSVLLGNGAGSFAAHLDTAVGSSPLGLAAGDLNRDGKLDLVVANHGGTTVSVLLGHGTGWFTKSSVTVGAQPAAVGLGDFNRDGKLDLVVGTGAGNVSVLPGNGAGGFGAAVTVASPAGATQLALGDFTTDGKLDVVATAPHAGGVRSSDVCLLRGNGAGGLAAALNLTVPGHVVVGLASADLNHDGVPDLVVGSYDPSDPSKGRLYLFLNDTFAPVTTAVFNGFTPVVNGTSVVYWTNHAATVTLQPLDLGAGMSVPPGTWSQYKTTGYVKGTSVAVTAPATHAGDGVSTLKDYSADRVGNVEDWSSYQVGVDTVKPVLADNAPSGWTNAPVTTVALAASDAASGLVKNSRLAISGWGFSVAGGQSEGAANVLVPAPYDHANDGVHVITFKARDAAGNVATASFSVRIDTLRPTVSVPAAIKARVGHGATLKYRILDGSNGCGAATVTVIIRNARGAKVAVWKLGTHKTNKLLTLSFPVPGARGTYTCLTYATDLAGNVQQHVGQTKLTVK